MTDYEYMKELIERVADTDDEYIVSFKDGEIYRLKYFSKVDESIYLNDNTFIAVVVDVTVGKRQFFPPGSMIEFSALDVSTVEKA